MSQSAAASVNDDQPAATIRPVKSFKQGGLEVSIWKNHTENGDIYNTTIRNTYKDDKSGEWKESKNFSQTDMAVLSQLSSQAFQAITELKSQGRGR